jgi:hypothetical protein
MPFLVSGNLNRIKTSSLVKFQKNFGLILSTNQFEKQQYQMIQSALKTKCNFVQVFSNLKKHEVISLVFLISQFGDALISEIPPEYSYFEDIPYIIEWNDGAFTIPFEIFDFLSHEKIFKDQNYLFALLPLMPAKEKKAWIKWIGTDYEGDSDRDLNHELYAKSRVLQKPFKGKSYIHENDFFLEQLWQPGMNKIVDWYYKGLTTFYFAMQELSRVEHDPFFVHVLEEIKAGKYVLKKAPQEFGEMERYKLVSTIEGKSLQLRETSFNWEFEKKKQADYLFYNI